MPEPFDEDVQSIATSLGGVYKWGWPGLCDPSRVERVVRGDGPTYCSEVIPALDACTLDRRGDLAVEKSVEGVAGIGLNVTARAVLEYFPWPVRGFARWRVAEHDIGIVGYAVGAAIEPVAERRPLRPIVQSAPASATSDVKTTPTTHR